MSHDDFAFEPIRGLPAHLPQGETLLWQGSPDWRALALHAFHARKVAIYFALLIAWRVVSGNAAGLPALLTSVTWLGALGATAVGLLCGLSFASARATVYTITSARLVLRHGIAVSITMNIPFSVIAAADVKKWRDGSGDISLTLTRAQRIGYLINWPHVQRGRLLQPRPSLRSLPDVEAAAHVLSLALSKSSEQVVLPQPRVLLDEPVAA